VGQVREEVAVSCMQSEDGFREFPWEGGVSSVNALAVRRRVGFRFWACGVLRGPVGCVLL
jgi:hypothetical protein